MSDKYILISLDKKESKDIANVISNDTARKILDYLGEKDNIAPVQISKALNIPLSTITYNLKLLKEQGLVIVKDFAWSEKGKKVELYSLAKKLIIIAPKGRVDNTSSFKTKAIELKLMLMKTLLNEKDSMLIEKEDEIYIFNRDCII